GPQVDERIARAEALDDDLREGSAPAAGAHDPMAVAVRQREDVKKGVAAEAAVEDDQRVLGQRGPHLGRQRTFTGAVRPEGRGGEEAGAQGEQGHEAQWRVAGAFAVAAGWAPEVRDILGRVSDAQGRAVEAVDGPAAPAVRGGRGEA